MIKIYKGGTHHEKHMEYNYNLLLLYLHGLLLPCFFCVCSCRSNRYNFVTIFLHICHQRREYTSRLFLSFEKENKMDTVYIFKYLHLFVDAGLTTLRIAFFGIVLSLLFGLFISVIRYKKVPVISQICKFYIELSRNTPLLVQLFFLYFGLPKAGIHISGENCALSGLVFLGASYMAEAFRSGLESVAKSQIESAAALGMGEYQIFRFVIIPQAVSVSIPSVCANIIFLIKETSVFSVCAIPDLMYVAKDLIGLYYKTDETLFMLVIAYLIILLPVSIIAYLLERKTLWVYRN